MRRNQHNIAINNKQEYPGSCRGANVADLHMTCTQFESEQDYMLSSSRLL